MDRLLLDLGALTAEVISLARDEGTIPAIVAQRRMRDHGESSPYQTLYSHIILNDARHGAKQDPIAVLNPVLDVVKAAQAYPERKGSPQLLRDGTSLLFTIGDHLRNHGEIHAATEAYAEAGRSDDITIRQRAAQKLFIVADQARKQDILPLALRASYLSGMTCPPASSFLPSIIQAYAGYVKDYLGRDAGATQIILEQHASSRFGHSAASEAAARLLVELFPPPAPGPRVADSVPSYQLHALMPSPRTSGGPQPSG